MTGQASTHDSKYEENNSFHYSETIVQVKR